jgi:methyl-accepting chemotaxis protein
LVAVVLVSLVIESRIAYHAGDLFFGHPDEVAFLVHQVVPLTWTVLPLLLVLGFIFYRRMEYLETSVGRLARGETLTEDERRKAQRDLLAVPLWVALATFAAFGIGLVIQIVGDPQRTLSTLGILDLLTQAAGSGVSVLFLVGLFDLWLAAPRSLLHLTQVDARLGKRSSRHGTTTLLVLVLTAWASLTSLSLGVRLSEVQNAHAEALVRVVNGEAKDQVAKEFFDRSRELFPGAGIDQKDDLTAIHLDPNTLGGYYLPPFFLILGLAALFWWLGTLSEAKQLVLLRNRMNESLEGGNLGQKLEVVRYDEVGELASAINRLTERQSDRIARLTAAAHAVEAAIRPLAEATAEATKAADAIVASSNRIDAQARKELGTVGAAEASLTEALASFAAIARSVEAQAGYVAEASSAMTEMASSIASVTKTTDDARDLTHRLLSSSQAGAQSLVASVGAIRAIEAASQEVNALTAAIAKISAQTNLLAMNAAIEAAHAGDTGAGFAVVAEEVRNLAVSSAESNKKIKQKTAEMLVLVENGVKLTSEVGQAFERINADVAATATLVSEINAAMQEQNVGTDQILKSTAALVDSSHVIQTAAEAQKAQNDRLKDSVGRITASFQAIHSAAKDAARDGERIRVSVSRLEEVSGDGRKVVDELSALAQQK